MRSIALFLALALALTSAGFIAGCDITADRELRRAEKALDAAQEVSADAYATADYNQAEQKFNDAYELAQKGEIQEARRLAIESKIHSEEAELKAKERLRILDAEMQELGR